MGAGAQAVFFCFLVHQHFNYRCCHCKCWLTTLCHRASPRAVLDCGGGTHSTAVCQNSHDLLARVNFPLGKNHFRDNAVGVSHPRTDARDPTAEDKSSDSRLHTHTGCGRFPDKSLPGRLLAEAMSQGCPSTNHLGCFKAWTVLCVPIMTECDGRCLVQARGFRLEPAR